MKRAIRAARVRISDRQYAGPNDHEFAPDFMSGTDQQRDRETISRIQSEPGRSLDVSVFDSAITLNGHPVKFLVTANRKRGSRTPTDQPTVSSIGVIENFEPVRYRPRVDLGYIMRHMGSRRL